MKSLLFDLDGTLNESGEGIKKSVQYAYERLGYEVPEYDSLDVFVGPPLGASFKEHGIKEEQVEEAIRAYRERYAKIGLFECEPYKGIYETLETLKSEGYRLFVATSKPEHFAKIILEHLKMDSYFEIIAGADIHHTRDSKTMVIEYLLEQANIDDPIMIGDTKFDVLGAKKLGIPCIGVSWGYGTNEELVDAGAVSVVDSMDGLIEAIHAL